MHRPVRGILRVREEFDQKTHRHHRVARLADPVTAATLDVPPLFDAMLVHADTGFMTLSGFERIAEGLGQREIAFAQSWLLDEVTHSDRCITSIE